MTPFAIRRRVRRLAKAAIKHAAPSGSRRRTTLVSAVTLAEATQIEQSLPFDFAAVFSALSRALAEPSHRPPIQSWIDVTATPVDPSPSIQQAWIEDLSRNPTTALAALEKMATLQTLSSEAINAIESEFLAAGSNLEVQRAMIEVVGKSHGRSPKARATLRRLAAVTKRRSAFEGSDELRALKELAEEYQSALMKA